VLQFFIAGSLLLHAGKFTFSLRNRATQGLAGVSVGTQRVGQHRLRKGNMSNDFLFFPLGGSPAFSSNQRK
jgi:hypothetical protein